MNQNVVIVLFSLLLVAVATGVSYDLGRDQSAQVQAPLFSARIHLESMWERYTDEYLETDTYRTLDPQLDFITTSEGQSYTMLRSVWMDDAETFRFSWEWTRDNLQKENTALFAWRFGERTDGSYGVQTASGGANSASDADIDIALALLLAHARWGQEEYLTEAQAIIADIWEYEVEVINGRPYLLSNDLDKTLEKDLYHLNPSYYAPYAFRIFDRVDQENDWGALVDTTYHLLEQTTVLPLGSTERGTLPPDWVRIDVLTGALLPPDTQSNYSTDYSYDAVRVPWRVALDYHWFESAEAFDYLTNFADLQADWETDDRGNDSRRNTLIPGHP